MHAQKTLTWSQLKQGRLANGIYHQTTAPTTEKRSLRKEKKKREPFEYRTKKNDKNPAHFSQISDGPHDGHEDEAAADDVHHMQDVSPLEPHRRAWGCLLKNDLSHVV